MDFTSLGRLNFSTGQQHSTIIRNYTEYTVVFANVISKLRNIASSYHCYPTQSTITKKVYVKNSFTFLVNDTGVLQYEVFNDIDRRRADDIQEDCQTMRLLCLTWLYSICTQAADDSIICLHWIRLDLQYKKMINVICFAMSYNNCMSMKEQ